MCIVTDISKSDCLLVLKDSNGNVIAEFNATETTFAYSEYTFTIKDYRNTYEIKLDDVTLINGGTYTTFDLLYTYLVGLRTDCRCECGGGGGGSAIWGDITGILADQTDLQTALDGKQDDLTDVNFGAFANGLTGKTTPLDADLINIVDTADTNKQKKVTFANVKSFLKTYFDSLYEATGLALLKANNLSDLASATTARTNLGLDYLLPIINQGADGTIVTGTTAETVTYAELISSSLIKDDLSLDASFKIEKTGSAGTVTLKMYINSTANLSGSPILIFQSAALGVTTRNATPQRYINIKKKDGTGAGTKILPTSSTSLIDVGVASTTAPSTITPDFTTNKYLVVSITLANSGDSAWGVFLKLKP
jgi:hypothetical protein